MVFNPEDFEHLDLKLNDEDKEKIKELAELKSQVSDEDFTTLVQDLNRIIGYQCWDDNMIQISLALLKVGAAVAATI